MDYGPSPKLSGWPIPGNGLRRSQSSRFRHCSRCARFAVLRSFHWGKCMTVVSLADHSRVEAVPDQVSCDLAGEAVILNLKNGIYFGLDPVGARIWSLIQKPTTFADLRI